MARELVLRHDQDGYSYSMIKKINSACIVRMPTMFSPCSHAGML
jgi:hypothetical protein